MNCPIGRVRRLSKIVYDVRVLQRDVGGMMRAGVTKKLIMTDVSTGLVKSHWKLFAQLTPLWVATRVNLYSPTSAFIARGLKTNCRI